MWMLINLALIHCNSFNVTPITMELGRMKLRALALSSMYCMEHSCFIITSTQLSIYIQYKIATPPNPIN